MFINVLRRFLFEIVDMSKSLLANFGNIIYEGKPEIHRDKEVPTSFFLDLST